MINNTTNIQSIHNKSKEHTVPVKRLNYNQQQKIYYRKQRKTKHILRPWKLKSRRTQQKYSIGKHIKIDQCIQKINNKNKIN